MLRSILPKIIASLLGLAGVTQAVGQPLCKPALTLTNINFSEMEPPTFERRWSAVVTVDASACAANSEGRFDIVFTRLKEIGLEAEFHEPFTWGPPAVNVKVDFWADEAVEVKRTWIANVTACPCRN